MTVAASQFMENRVIGIRLRSGCSFHGLTGKVGQHKGGAPWHASRIGSKATGWCFEVTRKRRKGFPSETSVKRGDRGVVTEMGVKEFVEKLGRRDLCPCGSGRRFQRVLPEDGPVLTDRTGRTTGGDCW
jgi:hypothetical protein